MPSLAALIDNFASPAPPSSLIATVSGLSDAYLGLIKKAIEQFAKNSYSLRRYGLLNTFILTVLLARPSRLGSTEWDLNSWTDSDVLAWKNSHLNGCNITAATVSDPKFSHVTRSSRSEYLLNSICKKSAIIAQVALTALSLLDLNDTHWSARAFMTVATVIGIISVLIASSQSIVIGQLNSAIEIRLWLSDQYNREAFQGRTPAEIARIGRKFVVLPLRISLAAQQLISLPSSLLALAGVCFLAGLGVYLGSAWSNHLGTNVGYQDNRNVLVAFIVSSSLPLLFWITWAALKNRESGFHNYYSGFSNIPVAKTKLHCTIQSSLKPLQDLRHSFSDSTENVHAPSTLPNAHQPRPAHGADIEMPETPVPPSTTSELTKVLQEAAAAQRKCAEACLAVAAEYERLSRAGPPTSHANPTPP